MKEKFFVGLLKIVNESPFSIALIDGVVKGSPMDPSPDNPLTEKLQWVAFHPQWGKEWKVLKHNGYMLIPYKNKLETITPLLSVEFHERKYIGSNSGIISTGEVQHIKRIRYDQGRTQPIMMTHDLEGAKERKEQRKNEGRHNLNDELGNVLDNFNIDQLNAPQLGPASISPTGISSGLTKDARFKIWEYINARGNQFPENWGEADFYELSCSFTRRAVGLPQTDEDDLNTMEGFYSNNKIEFVDVSSLKQP